MRICNEKLIRLQKYISSCGVMSRRSAETLIVSKKILVNGNYAKLGDKVGKERLPEGAGNAFGLFQPKQRGYSAFWSG